MCKIITGIIVATSLVVLSAWAQVAPQLLTTSNFIGPWYYAALLFSGLGSIVLLFGVLFSQQIREDLVRAATSPRKNIRGFFARTEQSHVFDLPFTEFKLFISDMPLLHLRFRGLITTINHC